MSTRIRSTKRAFKTVWDDTLATAGCLVSIAALLAAVYGVFWGAGALLGAVYQGFRTVVGW